MNETRQLAEFVHDTGYEDLPKDVVEACRVFLLDNLASALVGARTPWAGMVRELARESGGNGSCSDTRDRGDGIGILCGFGQRYGNRRIRD